MTSHSPVLLANLDIDIQMKRCLFIYLVRNSQARPCHKAGEAFVLGHILHSKN